MFKYIQYQPSLCGVKVNNEIRTSHFLNVAFQIFSGEQSCKQNRRDHVPTVRWRTSSLYWYETGPGWSQDCPGTCVEESQVCEMWQNRGKVVSSFIDTNVSYSFKLTFMISIMLDDFMLPKVYLTVSLNESCMRIPHTSLYSVWINSPSSNTGTAGLGSFWTVEAKRGDLCQSGETIVAIGLSKTSVSWEFTTV